MSKRLIKIQNKEYNLIATQEWGNTVSDPSMDKLNEYIEKLKITPGLIVDIGANQGLISILLRDNIKNTGIICIEPDESNFSILKDNIPDAKLYNIALSNINGNCVLQNFGGNQTFRVNKQIDGSTPLYTLDSLCIDSPMLLKIDVEGHEIEVLEGSTNTIEKYLPLILLEHHTDLVDKTTLFNLIEKLNYKIVFLNGTDFIPNVVNTYLLISNKIIK